MGKCFEANETVPKLLKISYSVDFKAGPVPLLVSPEVTFGER